MLGRNLRSRSTSRGVRALGLASAFIGSMTCPPGKAVGTGAGCARGAGRGGAVAASPRPNFP